MSDPVRVLLTSDLHLGAAFPWAGSSARQLRQALRDTLECIVDLAIAHGVAMVCIAGDLFEDRYVSPETGRFLWQMLQKLDPITVLVTPGNEDPWHVQSPYRQIGWSSNVHIFTEPELTAFRCSDVTVWGGAHLVNQPHQGFLRGQVECAPGLNVGLFHGSEIDSSPPHQVVVAPFRTGDVEAAGLQHALVGHSHEQAGSALHTYGGTPQRLSFKSAVPGSVAIMELSASGCRVVGREFVEQFPFIEVEVDISGADTVSDVRSMLRAAAPEGPAALRLVVIGEVERELGLHPSSLTSHLERDQPTEVVVGATYQPYDLESISKLDDVKGTYVRKVMSLGLEPDVERRVLIAGLRSLEGVVNLEVN